MVFIIVITIECVQNVQMYIQTLQYSSAYVSEYVCIESKSFKSSFDDFSMYWCFCRRRHHRRHRHFFYRFECNVQNVIHPTNQIIHRAMLIPIFFVDIRNGFACLFDK